MPAQFVGRFDRNAATIALELVRQRVIEQICRQLELADSSSLANSSCTLARLRPPRFARPPPPSPAASAPPPRVAERLVVIYYQNAGL